MWKKNILEPDMIQMPVWRLRVTCWMRKATNTLSEYVTLIAFPCQQCLHERASIVRCTYLACLQAIEVGYVTNCRPLNGL